LRRLLLPSLPGDDNGFSDSRCRIGTRFPVSSGYGHGKCRDRQHEAGLPAIMHGNAKSLEHHITTAPSDPEVHQQTCTRDMQPVEPAPRPETGPGRAMAFV